MMNTPSDYYNDADGYLAIYFLGATFLIVYNAGTGILQAVGDSKNPLYFLIATSILNIFLDLLFVKGFGMGVDGAAWATIISECISMLLVINLLMRTKNEYKVTLKNLKIDFSVLKQIVVILSLIHI